MQNLSYMFVWIFKNGAKELNSRLKRAFFFPPETTSKDDDIKIKRRVSPFSLPLPLYLPFTAVLSLFLPLLISWLRSSEIKVK